MGGLDHRRFPSFLSMHFHILGFHYTLLLLEPFQELVLVLIYLIAISALFFIILVIFKRSLVEIFAIRIIIIITRIVIYLFIISVWVPWVFLLVLLRLMVFPPRLIVIFLLLFSFLPSSLPLELFLYIYYIVCIIFFWRTRITD